MSIASRHLKVKDAKELIKNTKLTPDQIKTLNTKLTKQAQQIIDVDFKPLNIDLKNNNFKLEALLDIEKFCSGNECPTLKVMKKDKQVASIQIILGYQKDNNDEVCDVYISGYSFGQFSIFRPYIISNGVQIPDPLTEEQLDELCYFLWESMANSTITTEPICMKCQRNGSGIYGTKPIFPPSCEYYSSYNAVMNTCVNVVYG